MTPMGPADAALRIGCRIRDSAAWHDGRCAWIAADIDEGGDRRVKLVVRPIGGSLYKGTAGVGLFLAHLASASEEVGLRETACGALRHALTVAGSNGDLGLYTGSPGVAWAALHGSRLLDAPELGEAARDLLLARWPPQEATDLLHGTAGTALCLLDAHRLLDEPPPAGLEDLVAAMLERGETDDEGELSWPTGPPDGRLANLHGMGHGAAGIGLSLATAGAAIGRQDLLDAARAAARYERVRYEPAAGGWPDLRTTTRTGVKGPTFTAAWCHGTPGVSLARMRVWTLLGDAELLDEASQGLALTMRAIRSALAADDADVCLCHGLSGNADILLEGARTLPDAPGDCEQLAREVAECGIERYEAIGRPWPCGLIGEAPGLMTGVAGVGLFLLRLVDASVPSVLAIGDATIITTPAPGAHARVGHS